MKHTLGLLVIGLMSVVMLSLPAFGAHYGSLDISYKTKGGEITYSASVYNDGMAYGYRGMDYRYGFNEGLYTAGPKPYGVDYYYGTTAGYPYGYGGYASYAPYSMYGRVSGYPCGIYCYPTVAPYVAYTPTVAFCDRYRCYA